MKKRIIGLLLLVAMIVSTLSALGVTVGATSPTTSEGMAFTAGELHRIPYRLDVTTPETGDEAITFEAEIFIPYDKRTSRCGVIMGTYDDGLTPGIGFEIQNNGRVRVYTDSFGQVHFDDDGKRSTAANTSYNIFDYMGGDSEALFVKIAVIVNVTTKKASLYFNGEYQTEYSFEGGTPSAGCLKAYKSFCIGGDYRTNNSQYFAGRIKNITLYSDVRTDAELLASGTAATYSVDRTDPNLLLAYDLTREGDAAFVDLSEKRFENEGKTFAIEDCNEIVKPFTSAPKTFEATVYVPSAVASSARVGTIIGNYNNGEARADVNFEIAANGRPRLFFTNADRKSVNVYIEVNLKNYEDWTHVAFVYDDSDPSSVSVKGYINGVEQTVTTSNLGAYHSAITDGFDNPFRVGRDYREEALRNQDLFKGSIRDIALYTDARTAAEVMSDYTNGTTIGVGQDANLLLAYDFGNYVDFIDLSGNGYDLFDANDGLSFTREELYRTETRYTAVPHSFETWLNLPVSHPSGTRGGVIFGNYISSSGSDGLSVEITTNGNPRIFFNKTATTTSSQIFDQVDIRSGSWVHLAIVHDAGAGKAYCYVNGELKQTKDTVAYYSAVATGNTGMCIGGDFRYPDDLSRYNDVYFKGTVKDLAVYSDVRTAAEIRADYEEGVNIYDAGLISYYDLGEVTDPEQIVDVVGKNNMTTAWRYALSGIDTSDYAYSFAVIGDTQRIAYTDALNALDDGKADTDYTRQIYQWIADNQAKENIRYVFGLGDITEKGQNMYSEDAAERAQAEMEWEIAYDAMTPLRDANIPYALISGNHELAQHFTAAFGDDTFMTNEIDGYYSDGDEKLGNYYIKFEVGTTKYLLIALEFGAVDEVLEWASGIVDAYPDRRVIITTHAYLFRDGTTLDKDDVVPPDKTGNRPPNNGDEMWEKFVSQHENIFLVLSGHDPYPDIVWRQDAGVNGNIVSQFLIDPQGMSPTSTGMIALFHFTADGRKIAVEYISAHRSDENYNVYYRSRNQFEFDLTLYRNDFESYGNNYVWSGSDDYFAANPNEPITDGSLPHKVVENPEDAEDLVWQVPLTVANLDNDSVCLASSSAVGYETTPLVTLRMNVYVPTGSKGDVKMQGYSESGGCDDLYHILMKGSTASVWVDDSVAYTGDTNLSLDTWYTLDYSINLATGEFKLMIDGVIAYSGNLGLADRVWDGWIIARLQSTERVAEYTGTLLIDDLVIDVGVIDGSVAAGAFLYENTMEQYWSGHTIASGDEYFNSNINNGDRGNVIVTDPANAANKVWKIPTGGANVNNNNSAIKIANNAIAYNRTPNIVFELDLYVPTGTTGTFLMEAWSRDRTDKFQYFYQVDVTSATAQITPCGTYSFAGDALNLDRNTWYKIAFALDMVKGAYTIYVDGVVAATGITGQTNLLVSNDSFMIAKVETNRAGTGYVLVDDIAIYEGTEPLSTVVGETVSEDLALTPDLESAEKLSHAVYSYTVHEKIVLSTDWFIDSDADGILESKFGEFRYLCADIWGIGEDLSLYSVDLAKGKIYQKNTPEISASFERGEDLTVTVVLDLVAGEYTVYVNGVGAFRAFVGRRNLTLGVNSASLWQYATVTSADLDGTVRVDHLTMRLLRDGDLIAIPTDEEQTLQYIDLTVGDVTVRTGVPSLFGIEEGDYSATPAYFDEDCCTDVIETETKSSVRLNEQSGLRFATLVDRAKMDALFDMAGSEVASVHFGTLITPADYLARVDNVFTKEAFDARFGGDAEGRMYINIRGAERGYAGWGIFDKDYSTTHFVGSIVNIREWNYDRSFAAIGYLEILLYTGETITVYSPTHHTAKVNEIASRAKADAGYYSSLSSEYQTVLNAFAAYETPTPEEDEVPEFHTNGTEAGSYTTAEGGTYTVYSGVDADEIDDYRQDLLDMGFTLYAENALDENEFATYTGETTTVRLFYYPSLTENFRVLVTDLDCLPDADPAEYEAIDGLVPTLTQIGRNGVKQSATGSSQILQFADGSFAVVDGGPRDAQDAYNLLAFLYENKPDGDDLPRITWFFTHAHDDHVDLALDFMETYYDRIDLQTVVYNFPDYAGGFTPTKEASTLAIGYVTRLDRILSDYYPNADVCILHTGDRLYLPGCTVEVLHTYLDLFTTTTIQNVNETSSVWKFCFDEGKSALITGDTYPVNCNWMTAVYTDALCADIVQTPHHGRYGATAGFYAALLDDVQILLWTNSESFLEVRTGGSNDAGDWAHNSAIFGNEDIRHYAASVTVTIDMLDLSLAED